MQRTPLKSKQRERSEHRVSAPTKEIDLYGAFVTLRLEYEEEFGDLGGTADGVPQRLHRREIDYGHSMSEAGHGTSLGMEVESQVQRPIAAVFVADDSCGLVAGLERHKYQRNLNWNIVTVNAGSSRTFFRNDAQVDVCSDRVGVELDCNGSVKSISVNHISVARMARWLLIRHSVYAGVNSATVAAAFVAVLGSPWASSTLYGGEVVLIMTDYGAAYTDTLHDDDWVIAHGLGRAISGP